MTLNARIKELEAEQEEADRARIKCVCQLVFVEGEPTLEQQAIIARNAACRADHSSRGFFVVEVPARSDSSEVCI
jgi:hypothetical protein